MIHPSTTPSTSPSMVSFIQHLLASASVGTHSPSISRKRKRGTSPVQNSHTPTVTTTTTASDSQHNETNTTKTTSQDRESEITIFLALAGEAPVVKRLKTGDDDADARGEMVDGSGVKRKKKLSVICEEYDDDNQGNRDEMMEDVHLCGSPGQ